MTQVKKHNERSFIFAMQYKFQLKIKIINFWGPYVVHFNHRDSPYVVHFKRRDCLYVLHFICRDCPVPTFRHSLLIMTPSLMNSELPIIHLCCHLESMLFFCCVLYFDSVVVGCCHVVAGWVWRTTHVIYS